MIPYLLSGSTLFISAYLFRCLKNQKSKNNKLQHLLIKKTSQNDCLKQQIAFLENKISQNFLERQKKITELEHLENNLKNLSRSEETLNISKYTLLLKSRIAKEKKDISCLEELNTLNFFKMKKLLLERSKNLTDGEINNCILAGLGLSLKDCACLLNVSVNAIKMSRYRAKNKLRIPSHLCLKEFIQKMHCQNMEIKLL